MTMIEAIRSEMSLVESVQRRKSTAAGGVARGAYIGTACHRIGCRFVAARLFAYTD